MSTIIPARRILLVEEDAELQQPLESFLQSEGYHTEAVSTLEAALGKLDAQLYDLVLTDLLTTTPPKRGDTTHLQEVLRLRQACHPIPVGLLTTWPIDLEAAERAGLAFAVPLLHDLDGILRLIRLTHRLQEAAEPLRLLLVFGREGWVETGGNVVQDLIHIAWQQQGKGESGALGA